jgi:hypothetical protein
MVKPLKMNLALATIDKLNARDLINKGVIIQDHNGLFTDDSLDSSQSLDHIFNDLATQSGSNPEEIRTKWVGEISTLRKSKSSYSSFEKWIVKTIYSILSSAQPIGAVKNTNRLRYKFLFEILIPLYPALYTEKDFLKIKSISSTYSEYQENTIRGFLK